MAQGENTLIGLAYLGVALIWSTTPLAIQWSGNDVGFLFGVTARMVIGLGMSMLVISLFRIPMAWHRDALKAYFASAIGIYGAMLAVYFGSRFIPSGWISLLFGLNPIITGFLAWKLLGDVPFNIPRTLGMVVSLSGLLVIVHTGQHMSDLSWLGILSVLVGVGLHSLSMVLVKQGDYHPNGLVTTAGGLVFAVPAYLLTWVVLDGHWPQQIPATTGVSILYLGTIATVIGFALFYFVLKHVDATRVALLTLLTPMLALWLGQALNHELVTMQAIVGTVLILGGLAIYEQGGRFVAARL